MRGGVLADDVRPITAMANRSEETLSKFGKSQKGNTFHRCTFQRYSEERSRNGEVTGPRWNIN